MDLSAIHGILFNAYLIYIIALAVWSAIIAGRNETISGSFWGAVATSAVLAGVVLLVGILLILQGFRVERTGIYVLYMLWLIVIMPGLFTILRGRDDRSAAMTFSLLAFFNVFVAVSMTQRGLISPWIPTP